MSTAITESKHLRRDEAIARALTWLPWVSIPVVSLPPPLVFLVLFFFAASTDAAALYLFLSFLAAAIGLGAAVVVVFALLLYRKRWLRRFRDRLAADGISAAEVEWFSPELTTAERKTFREIRNRSPLLADAYAETLASRLMASRLIDRSRRDFLLVERRINRLALIQGPDTAAMRKELGSDREKLDHVKREAAARMAEAQARLQMIEAAASRDLSHTETYQMLQRLTASQDHLPLSLEIAQLERKALEEATHEIEDQTIK